EQAFAVFMGDLDEADLVAALGADDLTLRFAAFGEPFLQEPTVVDIDIGQDFAWGDFLLVVAVDEFIQQVAGLAFVIAQDIGARRKQKVIAVDEDGKGEASSAAFEDDHIAIVTVVGEDALAFGGALDGGDAVAEGG